MAKGSPRRAARSRATPAMHQASGRLASMARSKTTSGSIPSASTAARPGVARSTASRTDDPVVVVGQASSGPEQSMPFETTPFILRRPISKPPGSTAPTGASGTRSPTAKFQAPHTICSGLAAGVDGHQPDLVGAGDGARCRGPGRPRRRSRPSPTLARLRRPARGRRGSRPGRPGPRRRGRSRAARKAGRARSSSSELRRKRTSLSAGRACRGSRDASGPPVDTEAEGEPDPLLGSIPHGGEHVGVDHPAAAQLDPPRLRAGPAPAPPQIGAGDLELGGRLGEGEVGRPQPGVDARAEVGAR